ncbi:MAG: PhoH family protein [Planctomycetota bacterium]|nr:PhoH family protein [Planctomycetota bacterium]
MTRASIHIDSPDEVRALFGINDAHARLFRSRFNVELTVRDSKLQIHGDEANVDAARRVVQEVLTRFRRSGHIDPREVEMLLHVRGPRARSAESEPDILVRSRLNRPVRPRSEGQKAYVQAMLDSEVVFGIGPAGTGKTYLAVAMAIRMLREGEVKKLILARPAVEAGEKLGFLPGTYEAKVNPYLRPLYDALYDLLDPAQMKKFAENDILEVAPLAYMRGRTLADAFIILDEAQNTTIGQMKMFLTRMGEGSRMVVTGDITQIDLPRSDMSGLVNARRLLHNVTGVAFCHFERGDIVRHPVVQRIVDAYENGED